MRMSSRMQAVIRLGAVPGIGPASARKLLTALAGTGGELDYLIEYERNDLIELGLNDEQADVFLDADARAPADQLEAANISILIATDANAPASIRTPPISPWFFTYGDPALLHGESIGFSGSRDASPDAMRITAEIAAAASDRGWTVISGGARGIDSAAHAAAIDHGGATVVVLAQGILTWRLPDELDSPEVLVVSEFHPLDQWSSYRAMQRNKSITHLADRLVIPQAGEKGGTRNAAEYALKAKRPTWVIDLGREYTGNRALIGLGAQPIVWESGAATLDMLTVPNSPEKPSQPTLFQGLPG